MLGQKVLSLIENWLLSHGWGEQVLGLKIPNRQKNQGVGEGGGTFLLLGRVWSKGLLANHQSEPSSSSENVDNKFGRTCGEIGQNDAARLRDGLLTGRRLTPWKRSFVGAAFLPKKYRAAKKRKNKGNFGKLPVRVRLRSLIKIRFFFGGKETAKVGEKERKCGEPPGSGAVTRDRGLRGWGMSWPFLGFG